ncbi:GNAT family N-acetyltransferase [Halobacterium salinarum]|uniref:GNAT family N-acetyltransferase n=1 Tax=Halobacterium salinarum TaxID=2242 RepID=UPI002552C3AD|nr:GNAT family N-acetyltransferase [Halobacterium salinarum]MDL0127251.1 GNAT family N-acetyltransferase [Halobacterium salinarum]
MTVRPASGTDIDTVAELWVQLAAEQRAHGSHLLAAENHSQARDLIGQYVHADGVAVTTQAGRTVGFVMFHTETGFYETDRTRGVIDNLYVAPGFRGDGRGSALLTHAERELRSRGADALAIEALADNAAARRLYERRGYAPHRVTFEQSVENDTHSKDDP